MDAITAYNKQWDFFKDITGVAMKVHAEYKPGLLESAYEAAMEYLLTEDGHKVERQKLLPIFWKDVQLEQTYRMDLVIDGIIVELKAVQFIGMEHRKQLWNYMHLTHTRFGMLINFGSKHLYSEWYRRDEYGLIEQIKLV